MILTTSCLEFKWGQSSYFEIKIKFKISTHDYETGCERTVKWDFFSEQISHLWYCYIQYLVVTDIGLGYDKCFRHANICGKDSLPTCSQHRLTESYSTEPQAKTVAASLSAFGERRLHVLCGCVRHQRGVSYKCDSNFSVSLIGCMTEKRRLGKNLCC